MTVSFSGPTLSLDLPEDTKSGLDELAQRTNRSQASLAGEAIGDYVARELEILDGIKQGLADMEAGRVTPHDAAMRRIRATIGRAASEK